VEPKHILPERQTRGFRGVFRLTDPQMVEPVRKIKLCRDPDDDKFLSCALAADAMYLVSGDKGLGVLERIGGTPIVSPGQAVREHLKRT
jgi:predicted nucleic acid-binding protein